MARISKTFPHDGAYSGAYPHREHRSKKGRRYIKAIGKVKLYRREKEKLIKKDKEESSLIKDRK